MTRPEHDPSPALVVRRARWHAGIQVFMALLFAVIAGAHLIDSMGAGEFRVAAILFATMAVFLLWQTSMQFADRSPVVVVDSRGLHLPAAAAGPVPWSRVWRAVAVTGALGAPRVEIDVDGETFLAMKLGQRLLGDFVVRRRGASNGFMVLTRGLDTGAEALFAAMRRYWPDNGERA